MSRVSYFVVCLSKTLHPHCLVPFGKVRHNSRIESWLGITRSTMHGSILLAGTGVWKVNSVACGFSSIKIDFNDYQKSLISRINECKS